MGNPKESTTPTFLPCIPNYTPHLGVLVFFAGYSDFLHQLQLARHNLAEIWQKKWRNLKFQIGHPRSAKQVSDYVLTMFAAPLMA